MIELDVLSYEIDTLMAEQREACADWQARR